MNRRERRRLAALNRGRHPGYLHRLMAAMRNGAMPTKSGVAVCAVEHDSACGIYRGAACRANPAHPASQAASA